MIVAVASGKGGTGKTTVATSLAVVLAGPAIVPGAAAAPVGLLDCDVEEPNAAQFLRPRWDETETVGVLVPEVDRERCTRCGRCAEVCVFHAIAVAGTAVVVFPDLCHGCGSCRLVCPEGAIAEVMHPLGTIRTGRAGPIAVAEGALDVGRAMAVPVIRRLKTKGLPVGIGPTGLPDGAVAILDAPPGTSCPVVETLRGADFVLLVTEPTPFGLHDLELAVRVARDELGLPVGVVVNRDGIGDDRVDVFCREEGVPILMRIPYDRRIAEAIADGRLLLDVRPDMRDGFVGLWRRAHDLVAGVAVPA
jgi:MinD superfamily P-loop ATPase